MEVKKRSGTDVVDTELSFRGSIERAQALKQRRKHGKTSGTCVFHAA